MRECLLWIAIASLAAVAGLAIGFIAAASKRTEPIEPPAPAPVVIDWQVDESGKFEFKQR